MNSPLRMSLLALFLGLTACGGGGSGAGGPVTPTNTPPTANFIFTCTDLACNFSNLSSDKDTGDSFTSSWAFGDGTNSTAAGATSHTYASGASYNVTLTVTDSHGATVSFATTVTVTPPPAPDAPHAAFTVACASPLDCSFTDTSTFDHPGSILQSRSWDFGDGTVVLSSSSPAAHHYAVTAFTTFTTKLTVTDTNGKVSTSTQSLAVAPPATSLNCVGGGSGCVLTLTQAATVTAKIISSSCGAHGNQFLITSPITATLFTDGCYDTVNVPVSINAGIAFPANTTLQFAMISGVTGNTGLAFPPSIRVTGDFASGWTLTFDDGFGGLGEPDFNDVLILIKATP